jgi:alpha-mannosidase
VLHDELQHHARGCYSAVSQIKWYNRKCEHALLTAEKLAALAYHLLAVDYPQGALTYAWENVLLNQFHDILAGTSVRSACEDTYESYEESLWIAEQAQETALSALAAQVDTEGQGRPLIAFNPLPWAQTVPVETSVRVTQHWNEDWRGQFRPGIVHLVDDQGERVPCQVTALEHDGAYYVLHACFLADLPALGYRCYHLSIPKDAPAWNPSPPQDVVQIENEHIRLRFDPESGWLTSLFDIASGVELLRDAGGVPVVIHDPSDTWSHDVVAFDQEIGRFHAAGNVSLVESGPVRQVVRVCSQWGSSSVTMDYALYSGLKEITVDLTVDWHEQLTMLKLAFPLALEDPQSTASIPYGRIQRVDDGGEEPCQGWVDVSGAVEGQSYGLGLLNDCKYSYDVLDGELRLSILRSPVYAFHQPRQIEPGVVYHYTDQGEQTVRLALVPHAGTWVEGDLVRRTQSLNVPPIAHQVDAHPGPWPAAASLVHCAPANVVLIAIKLAEDEDDLILRGYETAGRETVAEIALGLDGARFTVTWKPHEIKTLRWRPGASELVEVNMLEEDDPLFPPRALCGGD